jgi:hypothetical protein
MVAHQVNDEIEHLRLDVNGLARPAQLLLAEVDLELGKPVLHYEAPQPSDTSASQISKTIASGGKIRKF